MCSAARCVCSRQHKLKDNEVKVVPYDKSLDPEHANQPCTVEVSGLDGGVLSEEYLEMYFETPKRSGGGELREVKIDSSGNVAFVTFVEADGED